MKKSVLILFSTILLFHFPSPIEAAVVGSPVCNAAKESLSNEGISIACEFTINPKFSAGLYMIFVKKSAFPREKNLKDVLASILNNDKSEGAAVRGIFYTSNISGEYTTFKLSAVRKCHEAHGSRDSEYLKCLKKAADNGTGLPIEAAVVGSPVCEASREILLNAGITIGCEFTITPKFLAGVYMIFVKKSAYPREINLKDVLAAILNYDKTAGASARGLFYSSTISGEYTTFRLSSVQECRKAHGSRDVEYLKCLKKAADGGTGLPYP